MADHGEGTWVQANRDFGYDDKITAKRGQVFQLGGHRNDGKLLGFSFISVLDPPPTKTALDKLPSCGTCGRIFVDEMTRDLCGEAHELSPDEVAEERRFKAHERVLNPQES